MDDKYRAKSLAIQTLEIQRDRALEKAQLSEQEVSKMDFDQRDALTLLSHYPAGMAMSQFVNTEEALALLESAKEFDETSFGVEAAKLLKERLNERRRLLAGFYLEVNRLAIDDTPTFSDNLVLEIADFILMSVPLLVAFTTNSRLAMLAMKAADNAANIRAQVAWGMVSDWDGFRNDLLLLGFTLIEIEQLLGNNVDDLSSLEGLSGDPFKEKDALFALQAIRSFRETLGL